MTKDLDWTTELKETLRQLWDSGMKTGQIAVAMGLRKNQVIGAAHRYKMPPRPSPIVRPEGYKPPPRDRPVSKAAAGRAAKLPPLRSLADDDDAPPPTPQGRPQKPATPRGDRKPQPTPAPAQAPRVWSGRCCFPTWDHRQPKTEEYRAALRQAKYLECGDPVCAGAGGKPALYSTRHYAVMFTHASRPLSSLPPERDAPPHFISHQEQL